MKLREFLERENITPQMFATFAGISYPSVYRVMNEKPVGPNICRKIFSATNSEVNLEIPYKSKKQYTKDLPKYRKRLRAPKKKTIYSKTRVGGDKREAELFQISNGAALCEKT